MNKIEKLKQEIREREELIDKIMNEELVEDTEIKVSDLIEKYSNKYYLRRISSNSVNIGMFTQWYNTNKCIQCEHNYYAIGKETICHYSYELENILLNSKNIKHFENTYTFISEEQYNILKEKIETDCSIIKKLVNELIEVK